MGPACRDAKRHQPGEPVRGLLFSARRDRRRHGAQLVQADPERLAQRHRRAIRIRRGFRLSVDRRAEAFAVDRPRHQCLRFVRAPCGLSRGPRARAGCDGEQCEQRGPAHTANPGMTMK